MLGHNQPIILHLLDIPQSQVSLEGVRMELIDAAFPLLKGKHHSQDTMHILNLIEAA